MSSKVEKLDGALNAAYQGWAEDPELAPDAGIGVNLVFQDDLSAIEALGFETLSVVGDQALGIVHFKDIPKIAAHPGVVRILAGRPRRQKLNTAARDIRARASAAITGAPVDGVWHAVEATGVLTSVPKATGKSVVIAILDTGIDITHPMFMSQVTPTKKTRILRIWDQGLVPAAIAECPEAALTATGKRYGVEYKTAAIDTHLGGGTKIKHKDCHGHGTHVAGIAVGGTRFVTGSGNANKVGIAPEADIIVVKVTDVPDKIFFRKPDASADTDEATWDLRFRDAVIYSIRAARKDVPDKAVVISMSIGSDDAPGDGLDEDARWLDNILDPAKAAGPLNFPKGVIAVKAAGNEGRAAERRVARIRIPSTGDVVVPLKLEDNRTGSTHFRECKEDVYSPDMSVHFWYRRAAAPLSVRFQVKLPHGASFSPEVMVGGKHEAGFKPKSGTTPSVDLLPFGTTGHRFTLDHDDPGAVTLPGSVTIHRHYVHFFVAPKVSGKTVTYYPGIYEMRIKADPGTEIFVMCEEDFWNKENVTFFVHDKRESGASVGPPEVTILDEFSLVDPLGRHVITVSAYNDTNGHSSNAAHHHIADFSSRGPLRDYSDPANPVAPIPKPDISAPGVDIESAHGRDTKEGLVWHLPSWWDGSRFQPMDGTSMATPAVAGVIALMLEKNPNLNTTEVRTRLAARAAVSPSAAPASTNAYGKGMVDAMTSHANA